MQALIDSLACILTWVGDAFTQLFVDLFEMLGDAFVYVFDIAGDLVVSSFETFDFVPLMEVTSIWSTLPATAIEVISAIGLHQAVSIIIGAYLIRFFLQLIPFVRLGS